MGNRFNQQEREQRHEARLRWLRERPWIVTTLPKAEDETEGARAAVDRVRAQMTADGLFSPTSAALDIRRSIRALASELRAVQS